MTEQEYSQAPGVRRSDLWRMHESPEKFKWFLEHPPEETPALVFGAMAHKLLLEPESFDDEYAVAMPMDRRTKEGKALWEDFQNSVNGRTVVSYDDFEKAAQMAAKVMESPLAKRLLRGRHEVPLFWTDGDTGIKCKVKLDVLHEEDGRYSVVDYKTAASARTDIFNQSIFRNGYFLQAYMYSEAVMKAYSLTERPDFYFIVQEKTAPYAVNVVEVTEDVMLAGMDCFRECIGLLRQCQESGYFFGYNGLYGEPNEAYLPGWYGLGEEEE